MMLRESEGEEDAGNEVCGQEEEEARREGGGEGGEGRERKSRWNLANEREDSTRTE